MRAVLEVRFCFNKTRIAKLASIILIDAVVVDVVILIVFMVTSSFVCQLMLMTCAGPDVLRRIMLSFVVLVFVSSRISRLAAILCYRIVTLCATPVATYSGENSHYVIPKEDAACRYIINPAQL